jgi:peroxiredoxin
MRDFIERHEITFPSLLDDSGNVFARYGIPYQPAWVFIDANGSVTKVQGSLDRESLEPLIADLIANS